MTVPVGQIGTGQTVSSLILSGGDSLQAGYEWVHGPSLHPFEPHEALDGVQFESFDDPALANDTGFPANSFFLPGDHWGCTCDFMPVWSDLEGADASSDESEAGGSPVVGDDALSMFKAGASEISENDIGAVREYSGGGYSSINRSLRVPEEPVTSWSSPEVEEAMREIQDMADARIASIDNAIQSQSPSSTDAILYRGVHTPLAWESKVGVPEWGSLGQGDVFTDGGYVSTTTDTDIAEAFSSGEGAFRIDIEVPAGTRALAVDTVEGATKGESEVLLQRGSRFEVLSNDGSTIRVRLIP